MHRLVPDDLPPGNFVPHEYVHGTRGRKIVQEIRHDHARASHKAVRQAVDTRRKEGSLKDAIEQKEKINPL